MPLSQILINIAHASILTKHNMSNEIHTKLNSQNSTLMVLKKLLFNLCFGWEKKKQKNPTTQNFC